MLPRRPEKLPSTLKQVLIGIDEGEAFLIKGSYQMEGGSGGGTIMASENTMNKQ